MGRAEGMLPASNVMPTDLLRSTYDVVVLFHGLLVPALPVALMAVLPMMIPPSLLPTESIALAKVWFRRGMGLLASSAICFGYE